MRIYRYNMGVKSTPEVLNPHWHFLECKSVTQTCSDLFRQYLNIIIHYTHILFPDFKSDTTQEIKFSRKGEKLFLD